MESYKIITDDGPREGNALHMVIDDDGDIHFTVWAGIENESPLPGVRLCNFSGGPKCSLEFRNALVTFVNAVREESKRSGYSTVKEV